MDVNAKDKHGITGLMWASQKGYSEIAKLLIKGGVNVNAKDFNWEEESVVILGKGNRYPRALAGNGVVRQCFSEHDTFDIAKGWGSNYAQTTG